MFRPEVKEKIAIELSRGDAARRAGLEGRARVCARRAAAAAAREYLETQGAMVPGAGVLELLQGLQAAPGLSAQSSQAIENLLLRVDEAYALPDDIDLLEDARRLAAELEDRISA
jgi:hypothetical protein